MVYNFIDYIVLLVFYYLYWVAYIVYWFLDTSLGRHGARGT